ncbi:type 1 fimbrial protein [Salmonella enterica subsp. enterica serovar Telhashomer]|nr:type 1 fimbrial protein [Salmonella enterica subsp. enterica serovar Telhashomer]EBQ1658452.1 type 1 fimbrial protein [Salmonella enterica]EEC1060770.1 type 1 fimbrial protein [Salmonella enterica subsp. enterica]EBQ1830223.1 type 1 fimbrial protein [Salmonella enterica]EBQ4336481.1 type 1 fimbrial protein [Salmonella enterica]
MQTRETIMIKPRWFRVFCLSSIILMMSVNEGSAADTSTVTITGTVKNRTCSLATDSKSLTVDLMKNPVKQFYKKGATASPVIFKIRLSPCGMSVTSVKVKFTGIADVNNPELLQVSGVSGIGLQFLSDLMKPIKVNQYPDVSVTLQPDKENLIIFYARLMTTGLPVNAGTFSANASFTMEFQ